MDFFGRKAEVQAIRRARQIKNGTRQTHLVTLSGRRQIGKTRLLKEAFAGSELPVLHLFLPEGAWGPALAQDWVKTVGTELGLLLIPRFESLTGVLEYLFALDQPINLILDGCENAQAIEPGFWAKFRRLWDMRRGSLIFLILAGRPTYALQKDFEALGRRGELALAIGPWSLAEQKSVFEAIPESGSSRDFLLFSALTGGVPGYVSYLADHGLGTEKAICRMLFSRESWFREEGKTLMASAFGPGSGLYLHLMRCMARGITRRVDLQRESAIPIGGYLTKLERDFGMIRQIQPVMAEGRYKKSRYALTDPFLAFWFAFLADGSLAADENFTQMKALYESRKDMFLQGYFKYLCRESKSGKDGISVGAWWDRSGLQTLDLVQVDTNSSRITFFDAQLEDKEISPEFINCCAIFMKEMVEFRSFQQSFKSLCLDSII